MPPPDSPYSGNASAGTSTGIAASTAHHSDSTSTCTSGTSFSNEGLAMLVKLMEAVSKSGMAGHLLAQANALSQSSSTLSNAGSTFTSKPSSNTNTSHTAQVTGSSATSEHDFATYNEDKYGYEQHPLFCRLTSQQAKVAFKLLYETSFKGDPAGGNTCMFPTNLMDNNTKVLNVPSHDKNFFHRRVMEENHSMPRHYVKFSRTFFINHARDDEQQRQCAAINADTTDSKVVANQVELQIQLFNILNQETRSKCELYILKTANDLGIKNGNGDPATTIKQIKKAWSDEPTVHLAEQIYMLTYAPREDIAVVNKLKYQIMTELNICFPLEKESDYVKKGPARNLHPKVDFLSTRIKERFRELHRILQGNAPHGVTIKISDTGKQGRRKKAFCTSYIHGWLGEAHKVHIAEKSRSLDIPSISLQQDEVMFDILFCPT
jgi:hypothetical protein